MVYAAYSAHVNPFESAIAAEFGFKNLRKFVRPSDRNFIAATIPPGGNSMDPWEKKKVGGEKKKKKKNARPMKYAYKRTRGGTKVAEADC